MPKFIIIKIILKGRLTTTGLSNFLHSVFLKHYIANFTMGVFLKGMESLGPFSNSFDGILVICFNKD